MMRSEGRTCVTYEVSGVIVVSIKRPIPAKTRPGTINGFGPNFGKSCDATPAKTMIPAVNGKNAKPDLRGEYPRTIWR
jgi:hypothetical protein